MTDHAHVSMFGDRSCRCTEQEASNIAAVVRYWAATVSERPPFLAPGFRRHRAGFGHIADLWGGAAGMTDDSIPDRENVLLHLDAKGDTVWGIWRVVGTHRGELYGIPGTDRAVDVVEVGLWRLEDGLIVEAWYFGDELGLLRQLGITPPIVED